MAERKSSAKSVPARRTSLRDKVTGASKRYYHNTTAFIKKRPLTTFMIMLGLLLVLLIGGRLLQKPPAEKAEPKITKSVKIYSIGEGPQAMFQAKVEKSGVVQIVAQAPGIVQQIQVKEGQNVTRGQTVISLATNYQGGNAPAVQTQIAQTQYQGALDTYGAQQDFINKQREVANTTAQNAQQTRDITRDSVNETRDLLNANQSQLDDMREQVETLSANNPAGGNDAQIAEMQGAINQLQGGVNQLRSTLRTAEFQAANDKAPAQLANLQKDATLKQLDVQEKTLQINKEVARLQVNLAYVTEAQMYPASPFTGKVEKISVKVGQSVSPGTVLATISSNTVESSAVLLVPQNVAAIVGLGEPSYLIIGGKSVAVTPYFVSTQATDGQLFSVFYDIPADVQNKVSNGDYVAIKVPLATANTTAAAPLIPIDAVYQNQEKAYVLIAHNNKAEPRTITPGNVYGSYVEVETGLKSGDQIIVNRNVIAGDTVAIK